jgi:hypothetical protein
MKINNWCRRLSAALVAGGLLAPGAVHAADLGVNLVVNGTFENVNPAVTGAYNSPLILDWTGPNLFAYSHDGSSSNAGVVPDYADGADPPGAGHWYFTPNNAGALLDVHTPGEYYQDIDLSTGLTAVAIANGATGSLSAYMSSYLNDADSANVQVEFRNAASAPLGTVTLTDNDIGPNNVWNLNSTNFPIPGGTASVRLSLYGFSPDPNRGGDGYMDNVEFIVRGIPEPSSLILAGLGIAAGAVAYRRRR